MFRPSFLRRMRHLPLLWWAATAVVALSAGLLVFASVDRAATATTKYTDSLDVFVATTSIEAGSEISKSDWEVQRRPVAFTPTAPLADDVPNSRVASRAIEAGEVFTQANLAPGGVGPVAAALEPGERGIEVATTEARLDARPGDRVDLIGTYGRDGDSSALVLCPGARVIQVGSSSMTVAVPRAEAPVVAVASAQGRITIAMTGPAG